MTKVKNIKIKDLVKGYVDNEEEGVFGYNHLLNIRPKYQREFCYDDKKKQSVIDTVLKDYPLGIIYWALNEDDTYEVIDGQQRILSICHFITNQFSIKLNGLTYYYHNLPSNIREQIENYELLVYIFRGNEEEKLGWFQTINFAGVVLTNQELLNATYTGEWLTSAKKFFSKTNCPAYLVSQVKNRALVSGSPIRQDLLETALEWISERDFGKVDIKSYMAKHQHDENANELFEYFERVIKWVNKNFKTYRKEMSSINWGHLYKNYSDKVYNSDDIEELVSKLYADEDVTKKSGIYEYTLEKLGGLIPDERRLSIRAFTNKDKQIVYERQTKRAKELGVSNCPFCEKEGETTIYSIDEMDADHIIKWSEGGSTTIDNCQCLCKKHNGIKW